MLSIFDKIGGTLLILELFLDIEALLSPLTNLKEGFFMRTGFSSFLKSTDSFSTIEISLWVFDFANDCSIKV